MKFELKRNCLAQMAVIALCSIVVTAHAAPIVITDDLGTVATVADPDHFLSAVPLGLSFWEESTLITVAGLSVAVHQVY